MCKETWKGIDVSFECLFNSYKSFLVLPPNIWPSRSFLAFQIIVFYFPAQIGLLGNTKTAYGYYNSIFGSISIHLFNLAFLAKCVAFLVFTALKLKNNEIMKELTSNDPKNMKKILKSQYSTLWPLS